MQESILHGTCFSGALVLTESTPERVTRRDGWVEIQPGLKLSPGCTGSGASQEVQGQLLPVPCQGPSGMSYRTICRGLLLMLALEVPRRSQAANQGQLPPVPGLGPLSKRYGVSEARCCLFERSQESLKHEASEAIRTEKPLETA